MQYSGALQTSRPWWVTIALFMGIASPILFAVIVVVGGLMRPDYSHISQAISELTQRGALNKPLLDIGLYITELMTIAFGFGVLWAVRSAGSSFRISAMLVVSIALVGLLFGPFPMDPVGEPFTRSGIIHLILALVSSLGTMAILIFAGLGWRNVAQGKGWSTYSFISFVLVFVTGLLGAMAIARGWTTVGLWQRLSVGVFLLWKGALAITLLQRTRP